MPRQPDPVLEQKLSTQILPYFVLGEALNRQYPVVLATIYKWSQLLLSAAAAAGISWGVVISNATLPQTTGNNSSGEAVTNSLKVNSPSNGAPPSPTAAKVGASAVALVFIITLLRDFLQSEDKQRIVVNMKAHSGKLKALQNQAYQAMFEPSPWAKIAEIQLGIQQIVNSGMVDGSFPWAFPPEWVRPKVEKMLGHFMNARPAEVALAPTLMAPDKPQQMQPAP